MIEERAKAGRAAAITHGVKMGPKFKLSLQQVSHAPKLIQRDEKPDTVASSMNVSPSTIRRALRNYYERLKFVYARLLPLCSGLG
jgi:DNA invertase Pin-like site-specific DNA recombinase